MELVVVGGCQGHVTIALYVFMIFCHHHRRMNSIIAHHQHQHRWQQQHFSYSVQLDSHLEQQQE